MERHLQSILILAFLILSASGLNGQNWSFIERQGPPVDATSANGGQNDEAGRSVDIHGDIMVVSVPNADGNGSNSGAVFVYQRTGGTWDSGTQITPADGAESDEFGFSVSVHGQRIAVSAPQDDDSGNSSGSIYIFDLQGGLWVETAKLTASDGQSSDQFGWDIELYGDLLVTGVPFDSPNGGSSGSVYAFHFDGLDWIEEALITPADAASGDLFGVSVDMKDTVMVVGASLNDDDGNASGAAYVFRRAAGVWTQDQKITASDAGATDQYGRDVAVDGDELVIGARNEDTGGTNRGALYAYTYSSGSQSYVAEQKFQSSGLTNSARLGSSLSLSGSTLAAGVALDDSQGTDAGTVVVFEKTGASWIQAQKVFSDDIAPQDGLGISVALDGQSLVSGAWLDDDSGVDSGSAYLFSFDGSTWSQELKLNANDMIDDPSLDSFGISADIDGNWAIVGAYQDDDFGSASGSAYFFEYAGGEWNLRQKVYSSDIAQGDNFGFRVAMSGDVAVISSTADDDLGTNSGAVYVFERSGSSWSQSQKLVASDGAQFEQFGAGLDIDGDRIVVGAPFHSSLGVFSFNGAAYVFDRSGAVWSETEKIEPTDATANKQFGASSALEGDRITIGARNDSQSASFNGAAYVFDLNATWQQTQKLLPNNPTANKSFGSAIDVQADVVVVGAPGDVGGGGQSAGSAYVFRESGMTFSQVDRLRADVVLSGENVGASVSIDDDYILVGATRARNGSSARVGSAFLYESNGTDWDFLIEFLDDNGGDGDNYGAVVRIDEDNILITSPNDDDPGDNAGTVFFYQDCVDLNANDICDFLESTVTNDDCDNPIAITPSLWGVPSWYDQDLFGTTPSLPGCVGDADDDVWFSFVAESANDVILSQDPDGGDAVIEVFDTCNGVSLGCFDNYGPGDIERAMVTGLVTGQTYLFRSYLSEQAASTDEGLRVMVKTFAEHGLRAQDCDSQNRFLGESIQSERGGSDFYDQGWNPTSGYRYRFVQQGGGLDVTITRPTVDGFFLQLTNVPGLQYGQSYDITVAHSALLNVNGALQDVWSDEGASCEVELAPLPPSTGLRSEFCTGLLDFFLGDQVFAEFVPGADEYRFTFQSGADIYTANSANYALFLFEPELNGQTLRYNQSYEVTVEARVQGLWSAPGPACTIFMRPQPENTQLRPAFCGGVFQFPQSNFFLVETVQGAELYEYRFMGGGDIFMEQRPSLSFQFHLTDIPFIPGTTYMADVRAFAGGAWSDFVNACPVTIVAAPQAEGSNGDAGLLEVRSSGISADGFGLFPNPNEGSEFRMEWDREEGLNLLHITIIDALGRVVEQSEHPVNGQRAQMLYRPESVLKPGLYHIQIIDGERRLQRSFIVQ